MRLIYHQLVCSRFRPLSSPTTIPGRDCDPDRHGLIFQVLPVTHPCSRYFKSKKESMPNNNRCQSALHKVYSFPARYFSCPIGKLFAAGNSCYCWHAHCLSPSLLTQARRDHHAHTSGAVREPPVLTFASGQHPMNCAGPCMFCWSSRCSLWQASPIHWLAVNFFD